MCSNLHLKNEQQEQRGGGGEGERERERERERENSFLSLASTEMSSFPTILLTESGSAAVDSRNERRYCVERGGYVATLR